MVSSSSSRNAPPVGFHASRSTGVTCAAAWPCSVAFAVLAAAQTAAAMALRITLRPSLSEHDFYFWWVVDE